jgi:ribonuclease HI
METNSLPPTTPSQQAELYALTQALQRAKNKTVNIYTDSKYIYSIIHSNSHIWKEWGFLTTKASPIINTKHILALLQVSTLPHKAAILHCNGHQ